MDSGLRYPIFLNLRHRPVLIVGGGQVALRKTTGLLPADASITIVAPSIAPEFGDLPAVRLIRRPYAADLMRLLPRWVITFAATNFEDVNAAVQADATAVGILCCRCDDPAAGDFAGAAMHYGRGVSLALSTQGASPALAARIRDQLIAGLDPVLEIWSELLATWRPQVLAAVAAPDARRDLLQRLASAEMEGALRRGGQEEAQRLFAQWLDQVITNKTTLTTNKTDLSATKPDFSAKKTEEPHVP